jgi:diguanylate cyclase (GGDEF)-like protein
MWPGLITSAALLVAATSTTGWLRTRRRLAEIAREREDLANSSLVIEQERQMLELVAKGASLNQVLSTLTGAIDRISPGALCSVMLLDEEQRRYLPIASALSAKDGQALHDLEIGFEAGACGIAASRNETVVVENIATDARFVKAREFITNHGLRSCWSEPIRDSRNNVLGTFSMYHQRIVKPRSEELRLARAAAQLVGNAIERIRAEKALSDTTRRLSLAERVARLGIWEANFLKATLAFSEGLAAMMELPGDQRILTVKEFEAIVHPDDVVPLRTAAHPANVQEGTIQSEFRLLLPSGSVRWMRSQWRFDLSENPPTRAIGAMIDITEEKNVLVRSQEAQAAAEASARAAREAERLEQERKTILELVAKDQPLDQIVTIMANAIASHLPGSVCSIRIESTGVSHISVYSRFPEGLNRALDRVPIPSIRETLSAEPVAGLSSDADWRRFIETSPDFPFCYYRAVPILRSGRLTGMIVSFFSRLRGDSRTEEKLLESWGQFASLAVERRGLYDQLSFRAQYDSLTTLLNRASLYDRLDAQIRRAGTDGGRMAVVYFDLDNFKEINDYYGHGAGDRALQEVSRAMLGSLRKTDFAARIGGDEFVVILPGLGDRREASRVAHSIVEAMGRLDFNGVRVRIGASFGVSIYPDDGLDTDALLNVADVDMYRAKSKLRTIPLRPEGVLETNRALPSSSALFGAQ